MKLHLLQLILILTITMSEIVLGLIVQNPVMSKYTMEMFWVDGRDRLDDPVVIDTFFDRCVCISMWLNPEEYGPDLYKYFRHEITGVLISQWQVLTSYNPYRKLVASNKTFRGKFRIAMLINRYVLDPKKGAYGYFGTDEQSHRYITCARQVAPPFDQHTQPFEMRHGIHSPLHDLMVLRFHMMVTFLDPIPKPVYDFDNYKEGEYSPSYQGYIMPHKFGFIQTEIAVLGDVLVEKEMKFASLGHLNDIHVFENRFLEKGNTTTPDGSRMITDCDEWIPREWGHFICLRNVYNYEGIASGGMLFGGDKLYGIGSFAIQKGGSGILVFTDVRPYRHLIYRTCTWNDQAMIDVPTETPEPWHRDITTTPTSTIKPT